MTAVTIRSVEFLNNPARFSDDYSFRVIFDTIADLPDDLEWKLIFVSSPGDDSLDQELDDCCVGPVPKGVNKFDFECSAPDPSKIPKDDVLGVAALILTGSYKEQEFVRVGYYQNTEYDEEALNANPPPEILYEHLVRNINDKPRVTRFHIKWDVGPPQGTETTLGAANSAPVPSADHINEDDGMEVDGNPNGKS